MQVIAANLISFILLASLSVFCVACDSDPFGARRATVISPYQLNQSESKDYYYLVSGDDSGGYGALESRVGKIGWNDRYILVWQTDAGLRSGWRIVDSQEVTVSDYLSEAEAMADPRVTGISVISADEAWSTLK